MSSSFNNIATNTPRIISPTHPTSARHARSNNNRAVIRSSPQREQVIKMIGGPVYTLEEVALLIARQADATAAPPTTVDELREMLNNNINSRFRLHLRNTHPQWQSLYTGQLKTSPSLQKYFPKIIQKCKKNKKGILSLLQAIKKEDRVTHDIYRLYATIFQRNTRLQEEEQRITQAASSLTISQRLIVENGPREIVQSLTTHITLTAIERKCAELAMQTFLQADRSEVFVKQAEIDALLQSSATSPAAPVDNMIKSARSLLDTCLTNFPDFPSILTTMQSLFQHITPTTPALTPPQADTSTNATTAINTNTATNSVSLAVSAAAESPSEIPPLPPSNPVTALPAEAATMGVVASQVSVQDPVIEVQSIPPGCLSLETLALRIAARGERNDCNAQPSTIVNLRQLLLNNPNTQYAAALRQYYTNKMQQASNEIARAFGCRDIGKIARLHIAILLCRNNTRKKQLLPYNRSQIGTTIADFLPEFYMRCCSKNLFARLKEISIKQFKKFPITTRLTIIESGRLMCSLMRSTLRLTKTECGHLSDLFYYYLTREFKSRIIQECSEPIVTAEEIEREFPILNAPQVTARANEENWEELFSKLSLADPRTDESPSENISVASRSRLTAVERLGFTDYSGPNLSYILSAIVNGRRSRPALSVNRETQRLVATYIALQQSTTPYEQLSNRTARKMARFRAAHGADFLEETVASILSAIATAAARKKLHIDAQQYEFLQLAVTEFVLREEQLKGS